MTPKRYQTIKELFIEASALSPPARLALLDDRCGGDNELRDAVERLLEDQEPSTAGLRPELANLDQLFARVLGSSGVSPEGLDGAAAPRKGSSENFAEAAPIRIPETIGRYQIRRLIAAGGMGVVYEAEQDNPKRPVALKVVRTGLATSAAVRRFEYEAQVVAHLRHPCIAQVFEAGTYECDGDRLPFFAMEYVPDAQSITAYAVHEALSPERRLELFLQVCDAVQHAHQRGVIHRDLKPSNVLVDAAGRVNVIDFGVARAADIDRPAMLQTRTGQLVGTLQYMSPEQVGADPDDVDTRADVYALGVILFELLTGKTPYEVRGKTLFEVTRIIREQMPARLGSFDRRWRGDAETIVQTALKKDRDRRYQSVMALSQDVRNFLRKAPISARPPSLGYQLKMLARRHSGFVIGAAIAVLALTIGSAVITNLYFEAKTAREAESELRVTAERESANARREARIAAAVNEFLNKDLLASVSPENTPNPDVTMREVLDAAAQRIEKRFSDAPLVEASVRLTLGGTYSKLGRYEEAAPHLERALTLLREVESPDDEAMLTAVTALGELRYRLADYAAADKLFAESLEICQRAWGDADFRTASAMNSLAFLRLQQGKIAEAQPLMERSIELGRVALADHQPEFVDMLTNLAWVHTALEQFPKAEMVLSEAYELAKKTLGPLHPSTLSCGNNLASIYNDLGRYDDGIALLQSIADSQRQVLGSDHPQTLISLNNVGFALLQLGRTDEAAPILENVFEVRTRVLGETHPHTLASMSNIGSLRRRQKRFDEAERICLQNLELHTETLGEDHPDTIYCLQDLVKLHLARNDHAAAEPFLKQLIERRERTLPSDPSLARMHEMHGICLVRMEHFEKAEAALLKAHKLFEQTVGDHPSTQKTVKHLVDLYRRWNREESRVAWEQRLE